MNRLLCFLAMMLVAFSAPAEDHDHEHGHEEAGHKEAGQEETGHGEASPSVGKDKGITEASPEKGFKLSPEAFKNFGIKTIAASEGTMKLSRSSIFFGLQERNLYRVRDGFFKRIDFKTVSKTKTEYTVSSPDLKAGDLVATEGLGFLRIAELAAFGGVSEGHSH